MSVSLVGSTVGRKKLPPKTEPEPKRQGTMIRVSDDFAEVFRKACNLEGLNSAEFVDSHFLPLVRRIYRELLDRETKEMGDDREGKK
jgi:hypothetical protein